MALTTSSNRVVATGDNVTTVFYFNRLLYDGTHLTVYLDAALQSSGYTVGGIVDPWTANYVTFSVAPGTGVQVILLRVVPLTQLSVYAVAGAFPAKTTEKNLDLLSMGLQQFDEILDRAVTLPVYSTLTAATIPDPADPLNYGKGLKIEGSGLGIDLFDLSATPFTSPLTTKGDLAVYSTVADRLAVGADGSFLIGASGQTRGVKYFVPGTDGYVLQSDSAQTDKLAWVAPNQPANPIINGNMEVWQRGTAFTAPATGTYVADRYRVVRVGTATGVLNVNRSSTANVPTVAQAGVLFNYSLEVDVTTAFPAPAIGDQFFISQRIEGYNWRYFAQRKFTLSFWVSSTKTGVHCVAFRNNAAGTPDRCYVAEFTVAVTDTWQFVTIVVPASPSAGTWDYINGAGIEVAFSLCTGTTFNTTAGAWQTGNFLNTANAVNALDNAANFFRITGVNLELGSVATPIQFRSFQEELLLCQRYYQKSFKYATTPAQSAGVSTGEWLWPGITDAPSARSAPVSFSPRLRTSPTVVTYNPAAANAQVRNITDSADCSAVTVAATGESSMTIFYTSNAGFTIGESMGVHWTADAEL